MKPARGGSQERGIRRSGGWRHRDHTRGSLTTSILTLALPMFASSLVAGVVFQLVDLTFLSRLGDAPMASVIIVNQTARQILFILGSGGV